MLENNDHNIAKNILVIPSFPVQPRTHQSRNSNFVRKFCLLLGKLLTELRVSKPEDATAAAAAAAAKPNQNKALPEEKRKIMRSCATVLCARKGEGNEKREHPRPDRRRLSDSSRSQRTCSRVRLPRKSSAAESSPMRIHGRSSTGAGRENVEICCRRMMFRHRHRFYALQAGWSPWLLG